MTILETNAKIFTLRTKHWPKKVHSFTLQTDGHTWAAESRDALGWGESPLDALLDYAKSARKVDDNPTVWDEAIEFLGGAAVAETAPEPDLLIESGL